MQKTIERLNFKQLTRALFILYAAVVPAFDSIGRLIQKKEIHLIKCLLFFLFLKKVGFSFLKQLNLKFEFTPSSASG